MNVTVDHLIQTIHKELSSRQVERFTMTDLIKVSNVTRSTVYYYFESIDDLYMATFQELIMNRAIQESTSFEDFIFKFVSNIADNKLFCLNFYRLTKMIHRRNFLISNLNKQLLRFELITTDGPIHIIGGFCFIIIDWFDNNLEVDREVIIEELYLYKQMIQKQTKDFQTDI